MAIKLSHTESKDWILTQYLNTVYLGDSAYGVGAAAQIYFNKLAVKLNVAQSAMLAAMINEPGYFSPDKGRGDLTRPCSPAGITCSPTWSGTAR